MRFSQNMSGPSERQVLTAESHRSYPRNFTRSNAAALCRYTNTGETMLSSSKSRSASYELPLLLQRSAYCHNNWLACIVVVLHCPMQLLDVSLAIERLHKLSIPALKKATTKVDNECRLVIQGAYPGQLDARVRLLTLHAFPELAVQHLVAGGTSDPTASLNRTGLPLLS